MQPIVFGTTAVILWVGISLLVAGAAAIWMARRPRKHTAPAGTAAARAAVARLTASAAESGLQQESAALRRSKAALFLPEHIPTSCPRRKTGG